MHDEDRTSELFRDEAGSLIARDRLRERIHWLVENAQGRVLDVGCAQGIASLLCARAGLEVLGIDNQADLIEYARAERERKPPAVRERLTFEVGDATDLDLPDDSFDTVLLGALLQRVPDPAPVLAEAARVAAPEGAVLVTVPFGYSPEPEDRRAFLVASLVESLAPHLTVDSIAIAEGHLRVRAVSGPMPAEKAAAAVLAAQPELEHAAIAHASTEHRDRRKLVREARRQRRTLERELRRSRRRERNLARRVSSFRRSRWTRLGRALAGSRTAKGLLRLPREAARALRTLPPAPPPPAPAQETPPVEPRRLRVSADAVAGTDSELRAEIPAAIPFPEDPVARPGLRVATILDPFSAAAFRYEWDQIEVGPDDWRELLEADPPDLLFIESAWRGNGDRWAQAVVGAGPWAGAFAELVASCRARGVPTVFWNKEDPPRFNSFLPAARLFDYVFTTDSNRVGSYQEATGNERASVLMFGAQPRVHNPVAPTHHRLHPVAFAGSYIGHKHPHRREQMEVVLDPARDFGLHIFTRVPAGESERFDWPEKYVQHIVGSLPYERMVTAFKAYRLFLNVNTVVGSPTMCARRAFEISATATPVLSGESRALHEVFGDLVSVATTADESREHLEGLLSDPALAARRGHEAMRHVMRDHTYSHRVDQVLRTVGLDQHLRPPPATISVVVPLADGEAPAELLEQVARQSRTAHEVIVAPLPEASDRAQGELLAVVEPECDYGEHFLEDLAGAFDYTDAAVVGKPRAEASAHSYTLDLLPGALVARTSVVRDVGFAASTGDPVTAFLDECRARGLRGYAADPYSFERRPLRSIGI